MPANRGGGVLGWQNGVLYHFLHAHDIMCGQQTIFVNSERKKLAIPFTPFVGAGSFPSTGSRLRQENLAPRVVVIEKG